MTRSLLLGSRSVPKLTLVSTVKMIVKSLFESSVAFKKNVTTSFSNTVTTLGLLEGSGGELR